MVGPSEASIARLPRIQGLEIEPAGNLSLSLLECRPSVPACILTGNTITEVLTMPRPSLRRSTLLVSLSAFLGGAASVWLMERVPGLSVAQTEGTVIKGWQSGKGWGWIWGKEDEVGSLNGLTAQSRASALRLATLGQVFDLGMTYSRRSYKWPGHSPGEILTFRSPDGIRRMRDADAPPDEKNADQVFWHSAALFISDNVATQIDGLGHITAGPDDH